MPDTAKNFRDLVGLGLWGEEAVEEASVSPSEVDVFGIWGFCPRNRSARTASLLKGRIGARDYREGR